MHTVSHEIIKGLSEEGEDTLLHHAASSVAKALEGATDEDANKHVASFVLMLRAVRPEEFQDDSFGLPAGELEKDATDDTSWQSHLKGLMHEQGHHYFGPLDQHYESITKHYFGDTGPPPQGSGPGGMDIRGYGPMGRKNPKKSKTHSYKKPQEVHGRGSGKRTLMGYIRAYAKDKGDDDVPTWIEMKGMQHSEVIDIARKYGVMVETRGPNLNVVDQHGREMDRRSRDISDVAPAPKRGAGVNVTQRTAPKHLKRIEGDNKILDEDGPRPDFHGKDRITGPKPRSKNRMSPKEQVVEVGRRRYGGEDPRETRPDQPRMNRVKDSEQAKRLREAIARRKTPKVHERDLPGDEPATKPTTPGKAGVTSTVTRRGGDEVVTPRRSGPGSVPELENLDRKRPRPGSPFRQKMEDAGEQEKLDIFEEAVGREKRLDAQVKAKEARGEDVPNALRVRASKAKIQRVRARAHLKGEGVDRNKLDRLQNAVRDPKKSPEGAREAVRQDLINRGGWADVNETAQKIHDQIKGQMPGRQGGTFEGSTLEDHTAGGEKPVLMPSFVQDILAGRTPPKPSAERTEEEEAQLAEWRAWEARQKSGYYVSLKGAEKVFDHLPTQEEIAEYLREHSDRIKGNHFGVWQDGGKYYLDVTQHAEDMDAAREIGRDNDQLAVWDVARKRNLTTKMPEEFEDDVDPSEAASFAALTRRGDERAAATREMTDEEYARTVEAYDAALIVSTRPDTQIANDQLYRAEARARKGSDRRLASRAEAQAFADKLTSSKWWKDTFPDTKRVEISNEIPENPRHGADAFRHEIRIRFRDKSLTEAILIHEMAHIVTSKDAEGHGPEYARNHVAMVREFRGDELADRMLEEYAKENVKVADGPAGSSNPDDTTEMNELIRLRSRLAISLMNSSDPAQRKRLTAQKKKLDDQIAALRTGPTPTKAQAKRKLKQQSDRLSANTRGDEAGPSTDDRNNARMSAALKFVQAMPDGPGKRLLLKAYNEPSKLTAAEKQKISRMANLGDRKSSGRKNNDWGGVGESSKEHADASAAIRGMWRSGVSDLPEDKFEGGYTVEMRNRPQDEAQTNEPSANTRGTGSVQSSTDPLAGKEVSRTSGKVRGKKYVDYEFAQRGSVLDTASQTANQKSYGVRFVEAKDGNGWMATLTLNGKTIKGTEPIRSQTNTKKAAGDLLRGALNPVGAKA